MGVGIPGQTSRQWPAGIPLADKACWRQWFGQWFRQLGISDEPVGAVRLQSMMREAGIAAEENLLSRGVVAMREE